MESGFPINGILLLANFDGISVLSTNSLIYT